MASYPRVTPHPGQVVGNGGAPAVDRATRRQQYRGDHDHPHHRHPSYACPRCYSTQVMAEPVDNPWDWIVERLGIRNMYCRQCSHTFIWL